MYQMDLSPFICKIYHVICDKIVDMVKQKEIETSKNVDK